MRILMLLPNDIMGGAEQYLKMIASYYQSHEVEVYFLDKERSKAWDDCSAWAKLHYPKSRIKYLNVLRLFIKFGISEKKSWDYVFTSHVYTTGTIGFLQILRLLKTKYFVARESSSIFLRFKGLKLLSYKLFYWLSYRKVDLLICQTRLMKDQLVKGFPKIVKFTEIRVLPNPMDFNLIEKQTNNLSFTLLPVNFIVAAGQLIPRKGFDILIHAYSSLLKQDKDLKLIILGEGSKRMELESLVSKLGLQDKVSLPGFVDNVYPYYKAANVCVVSSRIEGFPNVLLQMMSQNDKVVSTTCAGGIEEIQGIFIADTDNEKSLKEAIIAALDSSENNRSTFDDYLSRRDIRAFMDQIKNTLKTISSNDT